MHDAATVDIATATDAVAAIDAVVAAFYALFDNRRGASPALDTPGCIFRDDAVIVRHDGASVSVMSLDAFLAPRREWLRDGTLVDFHEWETEARTFVAGDVATRLSRYRKSGRRGAVAVDGGGLKSLQLVHTAVGWRIASVLWQDGDDAWREVP